MKAKFHVLLTFGLLSFGTNALAQSIVVPTVPVDPGQTAQVWLDYVEAATVTNLDFAMSYDETVVDEAAIVVDCSTSIPELATLNCSVDTAANQVKGIGVNVSANELSSTTAFAIINFPVLPGAAVGDSVNALVANFANVDGNIVSTQNMTWTLTVNAPPQPVYTSTPAPGSLIDFGDWPVNTGVYNNWLNIQNTGDQGSILSGECNITDDASGVFTIVDLGTGPQPFELAWNGSADVYVRCDTRGQVVQEYSGAMVCTHNTDTSPSSYSLRCNITEGPQPAYSDVLSPDPMNLVAVEEGDANPTGTITVTNTGAAATTLTGTCSYSGDAGMSLANGAFSLAQNASNVATLTCDATAEGSFNGSVSCTHNAGNVASPVVHNVSCTVGPPGPAVYSSNPAPGATIDMTPPGDDVLVGSVDPTSVLQITNNPAEANDRDLALSNCAFAGSPEITATPVLSPLAPYSSTVVTFTCDTAAAGAFTGTYSCSYDETGDGQVDGTATYTVNCGVRGPESEVIENPVSGSTLTIYAPLGGVGQASVTFSEILAEGQDGTLENCYLDDTVYFSIIQPSSFPQVIPEDGSVQVLVEGMSTADGQSTTTTLHCSYSDSNNDATDVSWVVNVLTQEVAIPTLSAWSLTLMIFTLLGLGGLVIRRRNIS
jgi:hypothetical protein